MSRLGQRSVFFAAAACFFISGAAALAYEVVWTRLLGLVFGHTVYAVTTVLAAYMGGLALGSLVLGRRADRVSRPFRAYALLEAAIGATCAATPLLFDGLDALYLAIGRDLGASSPAALAVQFALSAAVLVVPTALMGATLPILGRAVVERRALAAARVGTLYAINTWGAVVGTAATGLFLLPAIGLRATVALAAALDLLVAALALLVERAASPATPVEPREAEGGPAAPGAPGARPARRLVALGLAAAGLSGAASMGYEVAWTRALSLVLGSSTYAFTAMLTTFLVGLALGALLVSRLLRRSQPDLGALAWVELAVALVTLSLLPAFGALPNAAVFLLGRTGVSHGAALAVQFGLGFAVLILPTLLIGATFPLLVGALARGLDRLGRDVGLVYGANTIGTIVGAVAAGFLLVPAVGIQNTVRAAAAVNLCAGVALLAFARPGARGRLAAAAAAASWAALALFLPRWDAKLMTSGATIYAESYVKDHGEGFRSFQDERELLFYSEGISTTVAVERNIDVIAVRVNGKVDASNAGDMPTQLLLGHLGALLHPHPRRVLVVGLASGVTAGAVAQHPVEAIDVAELEPAMRRASQFFEKENRGVLADRRVRLLEGDGRRILAAAREPYDLVISEPSNPWIAGVASLFTRDFYRVARRRLAADGIFVQWLQGYGLFAGDLRMVIRTFQEVFPHVSVWAASPGDFLLIATPEPLRVDQARIERRLAASPGLRQDFDRFQWGEGNLLFRFFLDEEGARRFAAGAPLNTDDRPLLEFRAPLALYSASFHENAALMRASRLAERPAVTGLDPALLDGPRGNLRAARADWRLGWGDEALHQIARAGDPESLERDSRLERARLLTLLGSFREAAVDLEKGADGRPADPAWTRLLRTASELASHPPEPAELEDALQQGCRERGDPGACELLVEQLDKDLQTACSPIEPLTNSAGALYRLGDLERAESMLRKASSVDPSVASTHFDLGLVLEKRGRLAEASAEYQQALRLDPDRAAARERLTALRAGER